MFLIWKNNFWKSLAHKKEKQKIVWVKQEETNNEYLKFERYIIWARNIIWENLFQIFSFLNEVETKKKSITT